MQGGPEISELPDAADAIARRFQDAGCDGALHALDLQSGAELSLSPDQPVVLASVFKVFIALEFYAQVSAGLIDPVQRRELDPKSLTAGPTGLSIFSDSAALSWRDLCLQMMSVSDNAATDLLLARVGLEQVNARLRACGCSHSVVVHDLRTMFDEMAVDIGFSDYAHLAAARSGDLGKAAMALSYDAGRVDAAAAFDAARTNRSTPREMTHLLRAIWRDEAAPPEACASVRAVMAQQVSSRLGRDLPDGAVVAGKTGSLTGRVRNEVGVITHADGRAFAMAVFTRAHRPFERVASIEAAIATNASAVIAALR